MYHGLNPAELKRESERTWRQLLKEVEGQATPIRLARLEAEQGSRFLVQVYSEATGAFQCLVGNRFYFPGRGIATSFSNAVQPSTTSSYRVLAATDTKGLGQEECIDH